jgi:AraC-like DNA-binding protein
MHADPRRVWSLDELARVAGMSKSAFAQQFVDTVGLPPMRYWAQWRMSVARDWLLDRRYTVDEASDTLGYGSRSAFSRAYKAHIGESPGLTRRVGRVRPRTLNDRVVEACQR